MAEDHKQSVYKAKLEMWLCKKCVREFETEKLVDEHILSVHENIHRENEKTGVAEPEASTSRSQGKVKCEECRGAFDSRFLYYKHVATDHRNEVTKPDANVEAARATPKQKRIITCKVCNINFTSSYLYYKHVAKAHHIGKDAEAEQNKNKKKFAVKQLPKDQPKEDKPEQTSPRPPTKFTCKICGSRFTLAYFYYKHLSIVHEHKSTAKVAGTSRRTPASKRGSEKFTCEICQCKLNTNYQYYKHLATAHRNTDASQMSPK